MGENGGFRVFALDHVQHIRTIRKQLESVRATNSEDILDGSVRDWADYRERIGFLKGIAEALRVCDEIEKAERA
jgi:hypothetical protein